MKSLIKIAIIFFGLSIALYSCKNSTEKSVINFEEIVGEDQCLTQKIMYDVQIVNEIIGDRSKNNIDWFWENLPTPDSDEFVKNMLEEIEDGDLPIYHYDMTGTYDTFEQIGEAEVDDFLDEIMTYEFEAVDTTIKKYTTEIIEVPLDYRNVKKLRFLEEWYLSEDGFKKKVIAIAPYFVIEHPQTVPVHAVYFWTMVDKSRILIKK